MKYLTLVLIAFLVSGCALMGPDNTRKTVEHKDSNGNTYAVETDYEMSDVGAYMQAIPQLIGGSEKELNSQVALISERTKCTNCSEDAKAWANATFVVSVTALTMTKNMQVSQVVRDMKKPTSYADVWMNVVDKNTIPLLGAMGVVGWVTEALTGGALGTTNNVNTNGGDINDAFNRVETHFTGSTVDNGSRIEIPFLSPTTTTTTNN